MEQTLVIEDYPQQFTLTELIYPAYTVWEDEALEMMAK